MNTVRIGFSLGELYGLSCCAYDIGNVFLYEKTKEKVYITVSNGFGAKLHGKILIIDKSLYGLKTSATRFHEHLRSESLLRLGLRRPNMTMIYRWWTSYHIMNI
jgi:hypothetical protein